MDRGAWRATVHGVTKSQTRLKDSHFSVPPVNLECGFWSVMYPMAGYPWPGAVVVFVMGTEFAACTDDVPPVDKPQSDGQPQGHVQEPMSWPAWAEV